MNTYHVGFTRTKDSDFVYSAPVKAASIAEAVEIIDESLPIGQGGEILYVVKVAYGVDPV